MQTYTFTGPKGETTTVVADNERNARHAAMVERWGEPNGIYGRWYNGRGLSLVAERVQHD